MSLLSGILGNASEVKVEEVRKDIEPLLLPKEELEHAYKVIRDLFVFTNKRFIVMDKHGVTGREREYISVPYARISHFSIVTSGHFDMDSELRIWIAGHEMPIRQEVKRGDTILKIQQTLASYIFK